MPFNADSIRQEFLALPAFDRARLMRAMKRYQDGTEGDARPAEIDSYEGGIHRIKSSDPKAQGRGLFSRIRRKTKEAKDGPELLALLVVYKKESDSVPRSVLDKARQRKKGYEDENGVELH